MTNDKQTVEEAAREKAVASVEPVIPMDAGTREDMERRYEEAFLAGVQWVQEREKVIGERWVIVNSDGGIRSVGLTPGHAWEQSFSINFYGIETLQ